MALATYAGHNAQLKQVYLCLTILLWLFWLILIAGVSAVQYTLNAVARPIQGLPWFIIWFQFIILIILFPAKALRHPWMSVSAVQGLLASSATLCVLQTDIWCGFTGSGQGRVNTTLTGFVISAMLNYIMIIVLGIIQRQAYAESLPVSTPTSAPPMPPKHAPGTANVTATSANPVGPGVSSHPVRVSEPSGSVV